MKLAEPYRRDIDFAFFAANFGYSKKDYEELTPREVFFIRKAWEDKLVTDSYMTYNAVFTAIYNVTRKKNKKALKLWKKSKVQKADIETAHDNLQIVHEVEGKEGKGWIDRILEANGMKRKKVKHV